MNTYQTALKWHSLGVSTIPILAGSKSPALDSWKPYQSRLPTMRELRCWFAGTGYGISVLTGWDDLIVIDWDDAMAYSRWLSSLDGAYSVVARTYRVKTRRGFHFYFRCRDVRCWHGVGVDVKAAGGYILVPPTIHPSGHQYVGIGRIEAIKRIEAITDLLPDYSAELSICQDVRVPKCDLDPYDAAMRHSECAGISVDEIKARVTWADILPGLARGRGYHKMKCPIHQEDNPSFVIYQDGHAHCYACDFHGDVIDGWAVMHNLTVGEAMADLAERFL